jgi:hypothetical protein
MQMGKYEVVVMSINSKEKLPSVNVFKATVHAPSDTVVKAVWKRPFRPFQASAALHSR